MVGYYKAQDKTDEVIDSDGWFHTGDIGEFTPDGFLKITDRKKALFKLSTGKYVIPQPIENALTESALIEQAVVVGNSQKFCTALIFPNMEQLPIWASNHGVTKTGEALLKDPARLLPGSAVRVGGTYLPPRRRGLRNLPPACVQSSPRLTVLRETTL